MVPDGILQFGKGAVVHKRSLQRHVAQRRGAKLVPIGRIRRNLLQAKILIRTRPVKNVVGQLRRNLGNADDVVLKIAEHFVRLARYGVAGYASGSTEKMVERVKPILNQPKWPEAMSCASSNRRWASASSALALG